MGAAPDLDALGDLCTPWCLRVAVTLRIPELVAAGTADLAADFDALMGPPGHGTPSADFEIAGGWGSVRSVVDVGEGTGAMLAEILRARPHLHGVLVDLPRTVARGMETFRAAGVAERASSIGQSFFDPLPAGADLYLLRGVLNDWPDPEASQILRRCAEAARPDGRVVIMKGVGPDEEPRGVSIEMLLVGGRHRTLAELQRLVREAGLRVWTAGRAATGEFVVECGPERGSSASRARRVAAPSTGNAFEERRRDARRDRLGERPAQLPDVVSHADWSADPRKRWRAAARLAGDGRYEADGPDLVGGAGPMLERMGARVERPERALLGFDFPIGVPRRYAELAGIERFEQALPEFGSGRWERFFEVADAADEIGLERPFYPRTSGSKGQHTRRRLLDGLGLDAAELLRRCERAHRGRAAASPLFWTLGGAQVGKAALSGWREILRPLLAHDAGRVALWPFRGSLASTLAGWPVVIAETYPSEFYGPLGVAFGRGGVEPRWGKRQQADRARQASALVEGARRLGIRLSERLKSAIEAGFRRGPEGEDAFDAVVGLIGMLAVVLGHLDEGLPDDDPPVTSVEGWILGRPASGRG